MIGTRGKMMILIIYGLEFESFVFIMWYVLILGDSNGYLLLKMFRFVLFVFK